VLPGIIKINIRSKSLPLNNRDILHMHRRPPENLAMYGSDFSHLDWLCQSNIRRLSSE
jgi:hypothetical protein